MTVTTSSLKLGVATIGRYTGRIIREAPRVHSQCQLVIEPLDTTGST